MQDCEPLRMIENRTLAELAEGDAAYVVRVLRQQDIDLFAGLSGEVSPQHPDPGYPAATPCLTASVMWGGALISAVLGSELPGPGTIFLGQSLRFRRPMRLGDTITVKLTVQSKDMTTGRIILDCVCLNQNGEAVITGEAEVLAPRVKISRPAAPLTEAGPNISGTKLRLLIAAAATLPPLPTAVVHPCDDLSLMGALDARDAGIILPLLVGPRARIEAVAAGINASLDGVQIIDAPHSHAAAEAAVALVRAGRAGALMKGKLHTDELLGAVLDRNLGLRTERRLSHVYVLDVADQPGLLFITDGAINIAPDLSALRDIVQNAIDLCRAVGVDLPRVALLSAVETVTGALPSTLLAAAICKMHDRGQIAGGLVDGPLAYDNAISVEAALAKGIVSDVAGRADVLVAPNLESGNMIAKQLIHLGGAQAAGIALGASVPVMLTSRSDNATARLGSAAIARIYAERRPVKAV